MLVFDQEQYSCTRIYTLYTSDKTRSFAFRNALEAKEFIDLYYQNKIAAIAAYEMTCDNYLKIFATIPK